MRNLTSFSSTAPIPRCVESGSRAQRNPLPIWTAVLVGAYRLAQTQGQPGADEDRSV